MAGGFLLRFIDPRVDRHLLSDQGEVVIDEVHKHWAAIIGPIAGLVLAMVLFIAMLFVPSIFWLPLGAGVVVLVWALARIHLAHMDRFVITNMRVFRVHGVLNQHTATVPMSRILDISVHQPLLGQLLNYGHFVFESAAQDQGLREIRFVGRPEERDLTIQRVIQLAGLRTFVRPFSADDADDGT